MPQNTGIGRKTTRVKDPGKMLEVELLGGQGVKNILSAGLGLGQMLGDQCPLIIIQCGDSGKNAAQRYGHIIDVIHQADCFSGEWHGGDPRVKLIQYSLSALGVWGVKAAG
jgi:hypothetical protein